MASILDRYGIKEVADVTFYELGQDGKPTKPVLYLDTLKVSKGNPPLIIWDYGKEITVTLEDALFSAKSMAIMFGNGMVKEAKDTASEASGEALIMKTEEFIANAGSTETKASAANAGWASNYEGPDGKLYEKLNAKFYTAEGSALGTSGDLFVSGEKYLCTYDLRAKGSVIEISAASFPGTYYVTGDTYARSEASGKDEFFQFIIPKAKMNAENTITLEAEGDPSVFNMSLRVMRPADGQMMKLVKYDLLDEQEGATVNTATLVHNHVLATS